MILLVDEVKKRAQYLRQYLDNINTNLNKKKYKQTLQYISNQRASIQHTNVSKYNPNTFLIDSLKAKKQKLQQQADYFNNQKKLINEEIHKIDSNCSGAKNHLQDQRILTIISKIQLTIKDAKKIEFQHMNIQSNYQNLIIKDVEGKNSNIQLIKIFFIQKKHHMINFRCHSQTSNQNLYIIFKFQDQFLANKWYNCLTFGKLLQQSKIKRYLFMPNRQRDDIQPLVQSNNQQTKGKDLVSQDSDLAFLRSNPLNKSVYRNTFMPDNSIKTKSQLVQNNFFNQRSSYIPQNPFQTNNRNMTTSFIFDNKKANGYSNKRPEPLNAFNRMRGKSMYFEFNSGKNNQHYRKQRDQHDIYEKNNNDFFNQQNQIHMSKPENKVSFRKASEDITLRPKKQSDHEKKLQRFRSQRNLIEDILSQSHKVKKPQLSNSKRIQIQIQKKNQVLQRNRNLNKSSLIRLNGSKSKKSIIQNDFENEELHSQKNSKSSNKRRKFYQEQEYTLSQNNNQQNNQKNKKNENIQQVSQSYQLSPTFPNKIVYEQGPHIRLYPVETQKNQKSNNRNSSYNQSQQNEHVQPLDLNNIGSKQNQQSEEQGNYYNGRINTLDSQTDKQHQFHQSNSQDHQEEIFQQLLDQLKKGIVLTKCSQNSFWTRQKQIKLSQNQNTLLIVDVKDKKIKKVPIGDIISLEYGKYGKGIIKHITQIQERKCLILSTQQGKQIRKQQFVGNNPEKLVQYTNNLNYFVQRFKAS